MISLYINSSCDGAFLAANSSDYFKKTSSRFKLFLHVGLSHCSVYEDLIYALDIWTSPSHIAGTARLSVSWLSPDPGASSPWMTPCLWSAPDGATRYDMAQVHEDGPWEPKVADELVLPFLWTLLYWQLSNIISIQQTGVGMNLSLKGWRGCFHSSNCKVWVELGDTLKLIQANSLWE